MRQWYKFLVLPLISLLLWPVMSRAASTGQIAGVVRDQQSGEILLGANVAVVGTAVGATTDIDGKYLLRGVPAGAHDLRVSLVGYTPKLVTGLLVKEGETIHLDLDLTPSLVQTQEVVTTAQRQLSSESAIIAERKKAATISDGFSMEQVKRTPDATSGEALKRVTGLTLVDNKFVYIRGITDRYNGTMLDGASVSTTESGKKSFSFDQIPANLLENTTVIKSATPDLPGDFTGGLVKMNTLDFPDHGILKVSLGSGYNSRTTGHEYLGSQRSGRDWLGSDDGARAFPGLPAGVQGYQGEDLTALAAKLPNNFAPVTRRAPANTNFSIATGNRILLGDDEETPAQLGYIGALSYRNTVQATGHSVRDEILNRFYGGNSNEYAVLWGAIANVSYKFLGNHKISVKNNYDVTATDRVISYEGTDLDLASFTRLLHINWSQRSMYTGQIVGEHEFPSLGGLGVQWRASVSSSRREDPDEKNIFSASPMDFPGVGYYYSNNQRYWSHVVDRATNLGVDASYPLGSVRLKGGLSVEKKTTGYQILYLNIMQDFGIPTSLLTEPIDRVYDPANFGRRKYLYVSGSGPTDTYEGDQQIGAGYLMADLPFEVLGRHIRVVGGLRAENFQQTIDIPRTTGPNPVILHSTLNAHDILPSCNVTCQLDERVNLRFAYSQSVNRPEFRERSLTAYFDFVKYELVGGDTSLQRAYIHNYDVRLEFFPGPGELVAASYFVKHISNAIEESIGFASTRERRPFNSPDVQNYGWEFELRKSFDFLGGRGENLALLMNYTRVFSDVHYMQAIAGGYVAATRPLQGQSPYVVNVSVQYTDPFLGTTLSLAYNKFGARLDAVAFQAPDIYEEPRDAVDLAINQPLFRNWELKFAVRNLSDKDRVLTQGGKPYDVISTGTTYSLQVSMSL